MARLLETHGLTRRFPGVVALNAVDFDLERGEVHALFGENGAGKSTMIAMLSGALPPSEGEIRLHGEPAAFSGVGDARARGISAVYQEFSLVPSMSVGENIFLGAEPKIGPFTDKRAIRRRAGALLEELGFPIDPRRVAASLSRAEQQMVEIAKAFRGDLSILILDEPTASLTDREVDRLFGFIDKARADGVGVIYISHRLNEFRRIADRVTVLRDGEKVATRSMAKASEAELLELMAGRAIDEVYPAIEHRPGETLLEAKDLSAPGVEGVSFSIRRGEVLGVAGLVGSGKSRAFRALMGLAPLRAGRVAFKGSDATGASAREMIGRGAHYAPPDRKAEGLALTATARRNLEVNLVAADPHRLIRWGRVRAGVETIAGKVGLSDAYLGRTVAQLSGGNQQKTLFGKGFAREFDLYIFDEPTVGVDMGTRAALYELIRDLAEAGAAVVVISSDLPEATHLAHRLLVFSRGRIAAELSGDGISEDEVLRRFFDQDEAA